MAIAEIVFNPIVVRDIIFMIIGGIVTFFGIILTIAGLRNFSFRDDLGLLLFGIFILIIGLVLFFIGGEIIILKPIN